MHIIRVVVLGAAVAGLAGCQCGKTTDQTPSTSSLSLSAGPNNALDSTEAAGVADLPLLQLRVGVPGMGDATLQGLRVALQGDADTVASATLALDTNDDGVLGPADVRLQALQGPFSGGTLAFTGLTQNLPAGTSSLLVAVTLASSAPVGHSVAVAVTSVDSLAATRGGAALTSQFTSGSVIAGGRKTIGATGTLLVAPGAQNPMASSVNPGQSNLSMLQVEVSMPASSVEGAKLTTVTLSFLGTADESAAVQRTRLYRDVNGNGLVDASQDVALGSVDGVTMNDGTITFTGLAEAIAPGSSESLLAVVDLNGMGATGQTISLGVAQAGVVAVGAKSVAALTVSGTPLSGAVKTLDSGGGLFVSAGLQNPSFSTEAVGATGVSMLQLALRASAGQNVRVTQLTLRTSGFGDDSRAYTSVRLYDDQNGDGVVGTTEPTVGTAAMVASNDGTATFSGLSFAVGAGATRNLLVVVDFTSAVLPTESYAFSLPANSNIVAVDPASSAALLVSGAPVFGGLKTISSQGTASIALGVNSPGTSNESANAAGVPVLQFSVSASSVEAVTVNGVTLRASGTSDDSLAISGVHLYRDNDDDGRVTTPGDTALGTAQAFATDNGTVTFTGLTQVVAAGSRANFLVTYDLTGAAQPGQTFGAAVGMSSALVAKGVSSGATLTPNGTATGALKTVQAQGSLTIAGGVNSPGPTSQNAGATNVVAIQFTLASSTVEAITVGSVTVRASGTGNDATGVTQVGLYQDVNGDGVLDSADPQLGTPTQYNADNGTAVFTGLSQQIPAGQRVSYLVTQSFAAGVLPGQTFSASLSAGTSIGALGVSSGAPITAGGAAGGSTITIQSAGLTIAADSQNPIASAEFSNAQKLPMLQVKVSASTAEPVRITRVVATANGTANEPVDVSGVKLYRDVDSSGTVTTGDVQLGSAATFSLDNGTVQFSGLTEVLDAGASESLLFAYDLAGTAVAAQTLDLRLANNGAITGQGVTSASPAVVAGAPVQGGAKSMKGAALTITTGLANPGATAELAAAPDVPMLQLKLSAGASDGVRVTSVTFNGTGSLDEPTGISQVRLYRDVDANGRVTAADALISGPTSYSFDNGTVTFSGLSELINAGASVHWLVHYKLSGSGVAGQNFDVRLVSNTALVAESQTTGQPATVAGAAINSSAKTLRSANIATSLGANSSASAPHAPNELGVPMLQLKVAGDAVDPVIISAVTITAAGSINDLTDVAEVRLYLDADADGTVSSGDVALGVPRGYSADNGTATFSGLNQALPAGGSVQLLVVYDLAGTATAGGSFDARCASAAGITAVSQSSGQAVTVAGTPIIGNAQTIATQFNTWVSTTRTGAPRARANHTAVTDGTKMYIFGGEDQTGELGDGAIYTPSTNSWAVLPTLNAPTARVGHVAAIAGGYMVVFGGRAAGTALGNGARYNLSSGAWETMSSTNAPSARTNATAISTGSTVIVWGGFNGGALTGGAIYDPVADTWTAMTNTGAPSARYLHTAVWTGTAMVIWGGFNGVYLSDGARFTPGSGTWAATSSAAAAGLVTVAQHTSVWSGSEMLVWGGFRGVGYLNVGAAYNPVADTWRALATSGAPAARAQQVAVYTGSKMVIWGGYGGAAPLDTGAVIDPIFNQWSATAQAGAPTPRLGHTAVLIGGKMIVWGGQTSASYLDTGGRYTP